MKRKVTVVVSVFTLIISANLYLMNGNAAKTVAALPFIKYKFYDRVQFGSSQRLYV